MAKGWTPSAVTAQMELRRERVQELLLANMSQRQIAAELDCSIQTVITDIRAVREEWKQSRLLDRQAYVDVELRHLDALQAAHREKALAGSHHSSKVWLDCMRRRARLLGLDAPQEMHIQTQLDITMTADYLSLQTAVMECLADHPEIRLQVSRRLAELSPGPAAPALPDGPVFPGELVDHHDHEDEGDDA